MASKLRQSVTAACAVRVATSPSLRFMAAIASATLSAAAASWASSHGTSPDTAAAMLPPSSSWSADHPARAASVLANKPEPSV